MIKHVAAALLLPAGCALASGNQATFNHFSLGYLVSQAERLEGEGFGADLNYALTDRAFIDAAYDWRRYEEGDDRLDLAFISGGLGTNVPVTADGRLQVFGTLSWEQVGADIRTFIDDGSGGGGNPDGGGDDGNGGDGGDDGSGGGSGFCTGTDLDLVTGLLTGDDCAGGSASSKALVPVTASDSEDGWGASIGLRSLLSNGLEFSGRFKRRDYGDGAEEDILSLGAGYGLRGWAAHLRYERYDELELDEWRLSFRHVFGS